MKNSSVIKIVCSIVIISSANFGMSSEEKQKKLDEYTNEILDEKNKEKFHQYYFYEEEALEFIEKIASVDTDDESLTPKTLHVIQALVKQCSARFDRSIKQDDNNHDIVGVNALLESTILLHDVKKMQIFCELLAKGTHLGKPEYFFWLTQALYTRNVPVTQLFIDSGFSSFIKGPMAVDGIVYSSFYEYVFVLVQQLSLVNKDKNRLEQIRMVHFLCATSEKFFDIIIDAYKKDKNKEKRTKAEQERFDFLKEQKEDLLNFLRSQYGYECLLVALQEEYWDFVDYCLERKTYRIGVTDTSDILSFILNLDKEKFSLEDKSVLIRHFISRSKLQKTQQKLISYEDYKIIGQLAGCGLTETLRYALYSGIDLHNFDKGANLITYGFQGVVKLPFKEYSILVEELVKGLRAEDRDSFLNPKNGTIPLTMLLRADTLQLFIFLMKLGAHPWHGNGYVGRDLGVVANVCALSFISKDDRLKKVGLYLEKQQHWDFIKIMVEYAQEKKKLHALFNTKGQTSPLLHALVDMGDHDGYIINYFIENKARYTPEMLQEFITGRLFNKDEKDFGLKNLIKRVPEKKFVYLLDPLLAGYSPKQVWSLILALEKSERKDKEACLYAIFKHISLEAYQSVKKRLEGGESKKDIKDSLQIMKKLEKSLNDNQIEYSMVHNSNVRYADRILKNKEQQVSEYRGKYAFLH